jgi:RHS repeat-associated protein
MEHTMIRRYAIAITLSVIAAVGLLRSVSVGAMPRAQTDNQPVTLAGSGQSRTVLPDGRWVLLGGQGPNGPVWTVSLFDPSTQTTIELPARLIEPRAWHTATTLPDGSVLVVGGRGVTGNVLASAERFDPATETFTPVEMPGATAQAGHTATLLTDGRVLIVGGESESQGPRTESELWNLETGTVTRVPGIQPRISHTATLLADGRVLLAGGTAGDPRTGSAAEIFDPRTNIVTPLTTPLPDDGGIPVVMEVRPARGATDVPVNATVTLRLSHPVRIDTVTDPHVMLSGPVGSVSSHIVPAEGGRLVFVRPLDALAPNTTYTVTVTGVTDDAGATLVADPWTFTTSATSKTANGTDSETWIPDQVGGNGWRTNLPASPWQQLKPLQAPPGVTALAGQILRLNGQPLAGVTLEVDGQSARSDGTGRFLIRLDKLSAGHVELWIDGRSANRVNATYGTYEVGVSIRAGQTTALPYTIWMPVLDTAHVVTIPSPTTSEVVVSTPTIPGLELRLAPNTVIRDHEGHLVTAITITPVPLDRPPFPLPAGVEVPLYFTVQPGGAYIYVSGTTGQRGGRLIYPNGLHLPPGALMNFWRYEPDGPGWDVYGHGRVTPSGQQVVPDPGVEFYEFTGAMVASPGFAQPNGPTLGDPNGRDGDPVDLNSGLFVLRKTDLSLPDVLPIALTRTYRQADARSRAFGIGATHPYDVFLVGTTFPYTYIDLILEDGARVHFDRISPGTSFEDAVYEHVTTPTRWYKASITWNGNGYTLTRTDGTVWTFPEAFNASRPTQGALIGVRDRYGNTITLTRDANSNLTRIVSQNGRAITLTYDTSDRITQIQDNIGRIVGYIYDGSGRLWKVTDPEGGVTEYTYDATHRMLTVKDARGIVFLTNEYDASDRVFRQTQADQTTYQFAYTLDGQGRVIQTDVTNPRGFVRRVTFNTDRYSLSQVEALGTALERTTTLTRQAGSNFLTAVTDGLNRRTEFTYDSAGDVLTMKRLAGTPDTATTTYSFEPGFFQPASVTDQLGHTWTASYDSNGRLTGGNDPLGHHWTVTMNSAGQVTSVANALQNTWQIGYTGGDLTSVTDPLSAMRRHFVDSGGRAAAVTDALGQMTRFAWDRLNRLTSATDALGGQNAFAYDPNGNVLSLTDALTHVTNYTYDSSDRVDTRTDPVVHAESRQYDANGNVTQVTDRKGQVTVSQYDALDRPTLVTYANSATIAYTYDAGGRLTQLADSANGTITRTHDGADRLTQETTPQGTVSYTYDADGRRETMTVSGQPTVSYGYNNADQLTSLTQDGATVAITYDDVGRRSSLTFPNGIVATYGYDGVSHLTSLAYTLASTTLGNLTYTYDAAGNRTSVGGSWARTGLPAALASATYDAANRIASWGATGFSYDPNGNLASDGVTSYSWNARDQLTDLSGGVSASFAYDGVGRRRGKTVSGTTTNFLYDGWNFVQEQSSGGTPTANLLTGLGVDETLRRTDSAGARDLLTDALRGTLELADASGTLQTHYTFEPFGATTVSGATSTNTQQYTGRENDGTGLYAYRARFYSPALQRFLSEDPIEFAGGDVNIYAYVGNQPTMRQDPLGLDSTQVGISIPVIGVPGGVGAGPSFAIVFDDFGGVYWQVGVGVGTGGAFGMRVPGGPVSPGWDFSGSWGNGLFGFQCNWGGSCGGGLSSRGPWAGPGYTFPVPPFPFPIPDASHLPFPPPGPPDRRPWQPPPRQQPPLGGRK